MGSDSHEEQQLEVTLQLASHPVHAAPQSIRLAVARSATVAALKRRIRDEWDGHPAEEGVTVAKGARVLRDAETLAAVWEDELASDPVPPLVLNMIVRPSAWTAPVSFSAATLAAPPAPAPAPTPIPTPPAANAAGPYVAYLSHLQHLVPLQRALLLLNLQKAHAHYAAPAPEPLPEVEQLLRGVALWDSVQETVSAAEDNAQERTAERAEGEQEFRVVHIAGLPYLLHTPPALLARAPSRPPPSVLRARAIHAHLTTMLQLLVTLAPAAPSIAHGRTVPGPRPSPGAIAAAQQLLVRPGPDEQQQRRRATLSVIINLEAVFALLVPLLLLSAKLAFLLWLFGRNASPSKRLALGAMAAAWVALEGWAIWRRRRQAGRERDRVERERRRAVRAQARVPAPPGGFAAAPGPGPAPAPAPAARPVRGAGTPRRRAPPSRLSPKYWLNAVAAVGLVREARELGLEPRYLAGRPVPPPPVARPGRVQRALQSVAVACVLFVATLSPEVERKRRRALEKRDRLLAERRARDFDQARVRAHTRAGAPAGSEGEGGFARAQRAPEGVLTVDEGPTPDEEERVDPAAARERRVAAAEQRALGRARVPDAELFADGDGDGEAYVPRPPAAAEAEAVEPPPEIQVDGDGDVAVEVEEEEGADDDLDGASSSSGDDLAAPARAGAGGQGRAAGRVGNRDGEGNGEGDGEGEGEVDQVVALF